mmetsp:Transcript_1805/g.3683  ORF Transcript_1805/g.3683 Transcript_1805/m.3683 type:complete len:384 (+) Transcript_1805:154-1305(+)
MRAAKARKELEQQLLEEEPKEAAPFQDCGFALGRVVGGTERHGEVLVEIVVEGELDAEEEEALIRNGLPTSSTPSNSTGPVVCGIPRGRRAPKETPIVGDFVRVEWGQGAGSAEAFVYDVLTRRNALLRRHPTVSAKPQVLCSNLDLAVLVVSVAPNFNEGMVDRVLVSCHAQGLDAAVVLNKIDLVPKGSPEREEVEARLSIYEEIGYPVLQTSALSGEGIPKLRGFLSGRISILIGNSGVGKSQLLTELGQGEIEVRVGEINEKLKLGRHTTTTTTLHRLPGEGEEALLIDSPGARRFSIWDVEGAELKDHFVEFLPFAERCRFADCSHLQEPGCAVMEAVEAGKIPKERYNSYAKIRKGLLLGREGSQMHSSKLSTLPDC